MGVGLFGIEGRIGNDKTLTVPVGISLEKSFFLLG